jgi:hypothetical protein
MPFNASDIKEGMIAWFKINDLRKNSEIEFRGGKDEDKDEKVRPFVCCKIIDEDWCYWTPLTYEYKLERLKLERSWIENSEKFKNAYLNDGNHLYSGLKSSFVVLGKSSDTIYYNRPFVNSIGLTKITEEIESQFNSNRTCEIDGDYQSD